MDIAELSRKMEATPLGTHSNGSSHLKPDTNDTFSPRLTRSQVHKGEKCLSKEMDVSLEHKRKIDEVEKIHLNKKLKVTHKNLETIYEDPISKKGQTMLLGTAKVKRSIYLDREFRNTSKLKSKLRKMKIKRLGKKIKQCKMSDEEFKKQMLRIENYLNENECEKEDCDADFEICTNGNIEMSMSEGSVSEDKELGNEFMPE